MNLLKLKMEPLCWVPWRKQPFPSLGVLQWGARGTQGPLRFRLSTY